MRDKELRAWVYTKEQLDELSGMPEIGHIYAPARLIDEGYAPFADRLILLPPEYLADCEDKVSSQLERLYVLGFHHALAHTVGHIGLLSRIGFTMHGGSRLNVTNSETMRFFAEQGLCDIIVSPELTVRRINRLEKPVPTGFLAYGKLPLMLNRRCPIADGKPCGRPNCGKHITDRKGNELDVICSENTVEILNSDVLILSDRLYDFDTDFAVLRFTTENEAASVVNRYMNSTSPDAGRFTRGLYYRGIE